MSVALTAVEVLVRELGRGRGQAWRLPARDLLRRVPRPVRDLTPHLDAAMRWLVRAHDAAGGGGVAHSYLVAWHPGLRRRGWLPPYPETTGYIIPTLFDYSALTGDQDLQRRAV